MQSTQTQENWRALKEIALKHFSSLHSEYAHLTVEQFLAAKDLPATPY